MCQAFTREEIVMGKLIKSAQCLGIKASTNDQSSLLVAGGITAFSSRVAPALAHIQAEFQLLQLRKVNRSVQAMFCYMLISNLQPH